MHVIKAEEAFEEQLANHWRQQAGVAAGRAPARSSSE
jgi:hypothetical protein